MSKPQSIFHQPDLVRYIPAVLHEHKTGVWKIEYYALHPQTHELTRVRIRVNKIKDSYSRKSDARRHIAEMIQIINAKLAGGWSPFFEGEDSRLYIPLTEVCKLFLEERTRELRANTLRSYVSFCKMLTEWSETNAPKIFFSLFNHNYAVRYMDYLYNQRKVSGTTFNNQRKMGVALYNWAVEKCYTKQNAFDKIKPKRKEQKQRVIIPKETRQKVQDYLRETGNTGMEIAVNLVYSSLLRPNEIRQIKIEDLNLREKYIVVKSEVAKNHKTRCAALTENTISLIKQLLCDKKLQKNFYLLGGNLVPAQRMCGLRRYGREWDKIVKQLNIDKKMQLYSFRDTGIWEMLKSGIDDLTVMQHADHSSLDITTRYANHADPQLIEKINAKMPDF
jgi:integrase